MPGLPDLVFTANAGLVYRDLFIGSRFRYGVRQGEAPYFESWARSRGFRWSSCRPDTTSKGPATRLFCGETLIAGYRFRSDVAQPPVDRRADWASRSAARAGRPAFLSPRHVFLPAGAGPRPVIIPARSTNTAARCLRDRIPHLIEVAIDEAVSFSCNAVVVGRTVILNDGAPKLAELSRDGASACDCSASPSSSSRAGVPSV